MQSVSRPEPNSESGKSLRVRRLSVPGQRRRSERPFLALFNSYASRFRQAKGPRPVAPAEKEASARLSDPPRRASVEAPAWYVDKRPSCEKAISALVTRRDSSQDRQGLEWEDLRFETLQVERDGEKRPGRVKTSARREISGVRGVFHENSLFAVRSETTAAWLVRLPSGDRRGRALRRRICGKVCLSPLRHPGSSPPGSPPTPGCARDRPGLGAKTIVPSAPSFPASVGRVTESDR